MQGERRDSIHSAKRRSAGWLVGAVAVVALAGALTLNVSRHAANRKLSIELIRSLGRGDSDAAISALRGGADPNASAMLLVDSPPSSLREQFFNLFIHPPQDLERSGTTALLVAIQPDVLVMLPPAQALAGRRLP